MCALNRLAATFGEGEAVVPRIFGIPALYSVWTSSCVELADRPQIGDCRAYCADAVAGASAIYAAIPRAAEEADGPTPGRFIRDYARFNIGRRTHAATEKFLSGEIDVLLKPEHGSDWPEVV